MPDFKMEDYLFFVGEVLGDQSQNSEGNHFVNYLYGDAEKLVLFCYCQGVVAYVTYPESVCQLINFRN